MSYLKALKMHQSNLLTLSYDIVLSFPLQVNAYLHALDLFILVMLCNPQTGRENILSSI